MYLNIVFKILLIIHIIQQMLLTKALHRIFMVTWFAGLFYLPRLFVYHSMSSDKISIDRFHVMERKLLWGIMTPGGVLTLIFGFYLTVNYYPIYFSQSWMIYKLFCIFLLIIYHFWCIKIFFTFKNNLNKKTHIWFRWFNEVPVILLVAIIFLAIYKPL